MDKNILYIDPYVEVRAESVNVIYDTRTDVYDLAEVQAVNLSVEHSRGWPITTIIRISLGLAVIITILVGLDLDYNRTWEFIPFVLLSGVILAAILGNIGSKWTLTFETTYGPANILTSTDGIYLSKVKRAINKAIQARDKTLKPAQAWQQGSFSAQLYTLSF
jgi:hypothetical protein